MFDHSKTTQVVIIICIIVNFIFLILNIKKFKLNRFFSGLFLFAILTLDYYFIVRFLYSGNFLNGISGLEFYFSSLLLCLFLALLTSCIVSNYNFIILILFANIIFLVFPTIWIGNHIDDLPYIVIGAGGDLLAQLTLFGNLFLLTLFNFAATVFYITTNKKKD